MQKNQEIFFENDMYCIRKLQSEDYEKGYFELLNQLVESPKLPRQEFDEILKQNEQNSITFVAMCKKTQQMIGTLKILLERKHILNGCLCAYYEDMVVHQDHRKKGVGSQLTEVAINYCEKLKCHRIVGICGDETLPYYEKNNFKVDGIAIQIKFQTQFIYSQDFNNHFKVYITQILKYIDLHFTDNVEFSKSYTLGDLNSIKVSQSFIVLPAKQKTSFQFTL